MMRTLIFFCLISGATCVADQIPVSVPELHPAYANTPAPHDWRDQRPTFNLTPASPDARTGKIWVRQSEKGLVIAGHVDGSAPAFPASAAELMSKDHIEVWLSAVPNPELPVIGWGNQFGDTELPKGENSCAEIGKSTGQEPDKAGIEECAEWARKQKSYRAQFRRLFSRQWQLAPGFGSEVFAAPAYDVIEQKFAGGTKDYSIKSPKELKPQGVPELKTRATGQGYDFETLIPWKLFPPVNSAEIRELYLLVEVFGAALPGKKTGPYSTTAPGRGYADFAEFSRISLEHPRQYTIGDCAYPVVGLDLLDDSTKGYFIPAEAPVIADTFILENFRGGYAYGPSGLSPGTRPTHFFSRQIAPGEYLCGPALRIFRVGKGTDLRIAKQEGEAQPVIVDESAMDIHRDPSGALLIRNGPQVTYSKYGSGMCGACPRMQLNVYSLTADLSLKQLLNVYDVVGNQTDDMDLQMSPDWSRISVYRHQNEYFSSDHQAHWEDEFYCLNNGVYDKCGPVGHTPPPEPRTLIIESPDN